MASLNFNAQTVDPQQTFDPLPAGWYTANITASEMKPTKNGDGQYLQIELTVLEGEHANRKIFDRLNLVNKNQTAQEIAYRTLSSICHATGVIQVEDSQQLHGIPLEVKVSVRSASDGYDASNDVKGYRAVNNGMTQAPGAPAQQIPPQQPQMPPQQAPAQQQQPQQQGWQQPQQQPQTQPADNGGWQQPQTAPAQQPQTQQPQPQQQPPQQQTQQPPWAQQNDAQQHPAPTQGAAPSVNADASTPPWAQTPSQ